MSVVSRSGAVSKHRDITRPFAIGRGAIIAALAVTALLAAALSLGVGRGASESDLREMIRKSSTPTSDPKIVQHHIAGLDYGDIVAIRTGGGHAAYVRSDGSLWIAPYGDDRITGRSVQIGSNVSIDGADEAGFSISRNGTVSFIEEGPRTLGVVTRQGKLHLATNERRNFSSPRFSPDGKSISVDFSDSTGRDIYIVSLDSSRMSRATFERDAHNAAWLPSASAFTFTSYRLGALGIYRTRPGSRAVDSVYTSPSLQYSGEWLHDGSGIVTTARNLGTASGDDIALIADSGRGPLIAKLADRYRTRMPSVSRDGKWIAFVSNRTGRDEVYVSAWDQVDSRGRVSTSGGTEPLWSADGKTLYYRETSTDFLVALGFRTAPSVAITK
jgi:hypothetical protein